MFLAAGRLADPLQRNTRNPGSVNRDFGIRNSGMQSRLKGHLTAIDSGYSASWWRSVWGWDELVARSACHGPPNIGGFHRDRGVARVYRRDQRGRFRRRLTRHGEGPVNTRLPAAGAATPMTFWARRRRSSCGDRRGGGNKYNDTYSDSGCVAVQ